MLSTFKRTGEKKWIQVDTKTLKKIHVFIKYTQPQNPEFLA